MGLWQGSSLERLILKSHLQVLGGPALEGGVGLSVLTKQGPSDVKIRAPHTEGESVILAEEA